MTVAERIAGLALLDGHDLHTAALASCVSAARSPLVAAGSEYADDPWRWIADCVWTLDQADLARPVKRFPVAACLGCRRYLNADEGPEHCPAPDIRPLDYLRVISEAWHRADPPLMLVPKSRRMKLSWLMCALHTWLAATKRGVSAFIVSSKEEKSAELVDRCEFILEHVPRDRFPVPRFTRGHSPPRIGFPDLRSELIGIPEGPDQLRQYTASAIFADEIGTWKWPRATYVAMRPCVEGGGRITLVSSPYPGFWRQMVSGELTG